MTDVFAELRKHAGGAHPQKATLNIVLSAITDVIYERRGQKDDRAISNTEYFAALMTALESTTASHQGEILHLLTMVLPQVPEAVLRAKFRAASQCVMRVLQQAEPTETALERDAANALGLVLLAQEPSSATFSRPEVLKCFQALLTLAMDHRPKVRKAAQQAVLELVRFHAGAQCDVLSTHIASFCENVFTASSSKDEPRIVALVGFLKVVLPYLQRRVMESLVDSLIKLFGDSSFTVTLHLVICESFDVLVRTEDSKLVQDTLSKILAALLSAETLMVSEQEVGFFAVRALEFAIRRLLAQNESMAQQEFLPRVVGMICAHFESVSSKVQWQSKNSLVSVLKICWPPQQMVLVESTTTNQLQVHQRLVSSLESLLTLRFRNAWKPILEALSELMEFYGSAAIPAFSSVLKKTGELYEALDEMPPDQSGSSNSIKEIFLRVIGVATAQLGPETLLSIIPLNCGDANEIVSEKRMWLLKILREQLRFFPCRLAYFSSTILQLARSCEAKSREESTTALERKQLGMLTLRLWSLFPSFCTKASDIAASFRGIAKLLANAMADKRYPELRQYVCQGLGLLVKQTLAPIADDEQEDKTRQASDRAAIAKYAGRYLPLLVSFIEEMDVEKEAEQSQMLLETIESFAVIADAALINGNLFKKAVQKLLEATTQLKKCGEDPKSATMLQLQRASHAQMSIAMSFVKVIDDANLQLLYRVLRPYLLDDTDAVMQKRSYALLVAICEHRPAFLSSSETLKELIDALCDSLLTCAVPAKKMRLRSLVLVIRAMQNQQMEMEMSELNELIANLVGEIMLCTKETNARAREAAFDLLLEMAELMKSCGNGLMEFLQMLLGGLAAKTPHMRSAAVVCISRVVFEYGRKSAEDHAVISGAMVPLMQTILMLLHEKAREVIKSVISFMKLGIAILPKDQLKPFVKDIIDGLLVWIGESKNRFRANTRIILIKLVRKFGEEEVARLLPAQDLPLLKHIKKTKLKEEKQKQQQREKRQKSFEEFMSDGDDDSDDEVYVEPSSNTASRGQVIKEKDEIMDFLDEHAAVRNIVDARHLRRAREDDDTDMDGGFQMTKDGRMLIPDPELELNKKKVDNDDDDDENDNSIKQDVQMQLQKMGLGGDSSRKRKRDDAPAVGTGKEYRAKKAGGDIRKKNKLEPYAYIPLDPKLMAKRNKRSAVKQYGAVGAGRKKRHQK